MRKFYAISLLIVAMLLPFMVQAADDISGVENHTTGIDSIPATIDDAPTAEIELPAEEVVSLDTVLQERLGEEMPKLSLFEPTHSPDFTFFKSRTNPNTKPYTFLQDQTWVGIPVFLAGLIAKGEKAAFRQDYNNMNAKIRLVEHFHSEIDNFTQFAPLVLAVGLKIGGVEGRSDWPRLFASAAGSYAVMAGFVNGIKYTSSEMRPDGTTRNSWPSGHTATAFCAATILHKEYGLTRSPWYSIAGYTVATATGVMRVLNNRHWISDVLSGAGIGILSTELAYGICDLLFKNRGLLRNDISTHPDLMKNPSFFAISMGIGFGNKNLILPGFNFGFPGDDEGGADTDPINLQFRASTAVGVEGAWFFNRYVGVGGRLRVKTTPINGWKAFTTLEQAVMDEDLKNDPDFAQGSPDLYLNIESDHITEFAADAGLYFNIPLSSRFAIGTKLLVGRSIMDDIDINAVFSGDKLNMKETTDGFIYTRADETAYHDWDYLDVSASNSMKFGSGISLTYAYKNSFSWRLFCDYDYSRKTFTASYAPDEFITKFCPDYRDWFLRMFNVDLAATFTSSAIKHLHQWVVGGALCVSF